jgi:hypothetical protein
MSFIGCDIASDIDSSGEDVSGDLNGLLSAVDGDCARTCSLRAVVAAALATDPATIPRLGLRFTENLDAVDSREAREMGRRGGVLVVGLRLTLLPPPLTMVLQLVTILFVVGLGASNVFCGDVLRTSRTTGLGVDGFSEIYSLALSGVGDA